MAGVIWFLVWQSSPVSDDKTPVRVVIPAGWTARDIAVSLQEKGLIKNILVFRLTARVGGQENLLKPGAYDFNRSMSIFDILRKISSGDVAAVWVTVPEGYTIRQIGKLLEKKHITDAASFIQAAAVDGLRHAGQTPIWGGNLEGYLFPDTYLLAPSSAPEEVVKEMLHNFGRKVASPLQSEVAGSPLVSAYSPAVGRNSKAAKWHTVLTVAAMIEREAKLAKERPVISAVIWNRLRKGMKLEIDATVLYAMRYHKARLTYADLEIADPYNTYYVKGLPAGPIGNPGLDSIKAALNPAQVDYLYYVANASKGDGSHVFTRTLDEHNRAKRMVRRGS